MNDNEKILSMLDIIAAEVKSLKETSATKEDVQEVKDELRSFKEQTNHRFNQVEQNMVTKDEFNDKLDAIDVKLDTQNELLEAQLNLLNERVLKQEAQVMVLQKKKAL